jgi:hypothetical protein
MMAWRFVLIFLTSVVEYDAMAKGLKEPVEEDLRLPVFVAGDVVLTPRGEFGEFFPARHGEVLSENRRVSNAEFGRGVPHCGRKSADIHASPASCDSLFCQRLGPSGSLRAIWPSGQLIALDAPAGLRDSNADTKVNFMKTRIFPMPLVAIAGMALFGHFAMSAGEPNSSTSTTTATVTEKASASQTSPVQLSSGAAEVLKLARAQVNDDTIVAFVGSSKRTYNLSANEIVYLREQGVTDRVLTAMLDQRRTVPETSVAATAPQPDNPVAASAQYAPTVAQPPTAYVQTAPVYVSPPPVYAYPAPAYAYYDSYPYYYGGYWGIPFPGVVLNFGFGGRFHGGGFRGGGFHGGGFHGGGHR